MWASLFDWVVFLLFLYIVGCGFQNLRDDG